MPTNLGGSRGNSPETKKPLSWRQDPDESLSDWTITLKISGRTSDDGEVGTLDGDLQTEFQVHRVFLGVGSRRSLYFERLFKSNQDLAENLQSKSTVEVDMSVAKAFPRMLDYMYSYATDDPLNVSTDSAVSLRWLANYFGIEPPVCGLL